MTGSAPFKFLAATGLYCAAHSALASRKAKSLVTQILGERARNGLYRPMFNLQSVIGLGALYMYARRLPSPIIYECHGKARRVLRSFQTAGLLYAVWAAAEVGVASITGLKPLLEYASGEQHISPEPEAQGPAPGRNGMKAEGPFILSRHPLNLAPVIISWAQPKMTTNLLIFNLLATVYLIIGSLHEEARLKAAYGEAYERYQSSGVPFYVPALPVGPLEKKSA